MAQALVRETLSVADYLAGEEKAGDRHEYLAGEVYAMSGASARHNAICLNLASALHRHLVGGPCRVFMADLKVRLSFNDEDYFYYPDIMVACQPSDNASHFRTEPSVLVEVMSPSTERVDRREKLFAYRTLDSLREYVLIGQDTPEVVAYVRTEQRWSTQRPDVAGVLSIPSLSFSIPVAELYRGLEGL